LKRPFPHLPEALGGPCNFEEIPPTELCAAAKHVFRLDRMAWGSDEHLRAILELSI
jgi:hypothetical protein